METGSYICLYWLRALIHVQDGINNHNESKLYTANGTESDEQEQCGNQPTQIPRRTTCLKSVSFEAGPHRNKAKYVAQFPKHRLNADANYIQGTANYVGAKEAVFSAHDRSAHPDAAAPIPEL
jgi:hypothetical protein